MMRTTKNSQNGIRVKIVLKLANKPKMVEIETDAALVSRSEINSLNYDSRIYL